MGVLYWNGCHGTRCNNNSEPEAGADFSIPELDHGLTEIGGLQNDEPTASIMPVDESDPEAIDQDETDSRDSSSAAGCGCKKNFLQSFVLLVGSLLIFNLKE